MPSAHLVCEMTDILSPLKASGRGGRLPAIVIGADDHEALIRLAEVATGSNAYAASLLLNELDRARVVPNEKLSKGVVRLNAHVTYSTGASAPRRVQIVLPQDADISAGRISVLTPIAAGLLGLSEGQSFTVKTADGRPQLLNVHSVEAPL